MCSTSSLSSHCQVLTVTVFTIRLSQTIFSALQYPRQVTGPTKEIAKGAILGPFNAVTTEHYPCSPLLTQPKGFG